MLAGVAVAGESAAVPGLGPATWLPPWDLAAGPSPVLVTILLVVADGLGGLAVWFGLRALRRGAAPPEPRRVAAAGLLAVAVLVVVPPLGSADHLSYAAYGRIAASGDDPYLVHPDRWREGLDPVAGAVQLPWRSTPSVYGPVATAVQALNAGMGGGSLRRTVWFWQLVAGVAFLAVGVLLDRLTKHDPGLRARAVTVWTLNPLLLGQLVLGAHLDVLAAAFALCVIALASRAPLVAGLLLGAAAGVKLPYAVVGVAAAWALRRRPPARLARHLLAGAAGALAVLTPAYLWAGPHAFDQLGQAGQMVSRATLWRPLVDGVGALVGPEAPRAVVTPLAGFLALWLAWLLARRWPWSSPGPAVGEGGHFGQRHADQSEPICPRPFPRLDPDPVRDRSRREITEAARVAVVLSTAWVFTTPYVLPWYDALVWAPLALAGPSWLDGVLLLRLSVLAVAYVPGRVVGMSPCVEAATLGIRSVVAPAVILALALIVVRRTRWGASQRIPLQTSRDTAGGP